MNDPIIRKAVLISINKPHTDNIFSGQKGLEWRKKRLPEGLYYVYETKNKGGCGMVVGEMHITGSKEVDTGGPLEVCLVNAGCVHPVTLKKYANNGIVYANIIRDTKRYEKPRPLSDFESWNCSVYFEDGLPMPTHEIKRPPQSWFYVRRIDNA